MSNQQESSRGGRFWPGFRSEAIACLKHWLAMGSSGSLVGLAGAGKSNLLQYISLHPKRLINNNRTHFVALIPIDLNHLVDRQPATLYRLILRACMNLRYRFAEPLPEQISQLYEEHKGTTDLFLAQTAVYDLLLGVEQHQGQLVLILDQFDRYCQTASPELTMPLRALRDSFKETLLYIVGMRQAVMYMPNPEVLGDLYPLLDMHVCWVGAMKEADARQFIVHEMRRGKQTISEHEIERLITLTGGYASVLKAACAWFMSLEKRPSTNRQQSADEWHALLAPLPTIKNRLNDLWQGLTQEDQWVLGRLQSGAKSAQEMLSTEVLARLGHRGVCRLEDDSWHINGTLLHDFVQTAVKQGLGRIWQDELTGELYQGLQRVDGLRPLEEALLIFLIHHPYKPHSKSELIRQVWPEGTQRAGVTDDSLYQIVGRVRQKIEPEEADSFVYLRTKRGVNEGGYQFFPEGYPAS